MYQQMDMGVNITYRWNYGALLIRAIVKDLEMRQWHHNDIAALKQGVRGQSEGHDEHMLDVARLLFESCNQVNENILRR